ncbi:MAG: bifunctional oligoribonuclease/PAP phosphatase NrnA [Flavobacteriaceae bacterium]|nr:bifunctional oligoribonuclease/PAP phosphatase NrnA [Flavobacteriaceae bacterium]
MTTNEIAEIKSLLQEPKNIVIVPHKNPDGDAMGSTLGLLHYLNLYNHDAVVITPNNYPHFLQWLPGNDSVINFEKHASKAAHLIKKSDLIFTLDFNALHRIGQMEQHVLSANAIKILIDHHQQPDAYAKYRYSEPSICSTCQMVYHFIDMLKDTDKINRSIATCLYTGIMTDTGSFRFPSTTSETHKIIASLIDKGANNAQIHSNVYDTNSYSKLQLLGCAMNNLEIIKEYNTAYITLSQEELDTYNYKKGDTEGVVNYGLSVNGIKFAAIFIENQAEGIIKISLRSKGAIDVNTIARTHFNGGGHINAAGGRSTLSMEKTLEKFKLILPQYSNDLQS